MNTDLSYTFTLYQTEHIIVRYQFSAYNHAITYAFTRLYIDSVKQQTYSISGNAYFAGNSGMWQGILLSGKHSIIVQLRSGRTYTQTVSGSDYRARAMDIVRCY